MPARCNVKGNATQRNLLLFKASQIWHHWHRWRIIRPLPTRLPGPCYLGDNDSGKYSSDSIGEYVGYEQWTGELAL